MTKRSSKSPSPPAFATWLLLRSIDEPRSLDMQADLADLYRRRAAQQGRTLANLLYLRDVASIWLRRRSFCRTQLTYEHARGPFMWKNYLKTAFRSLNRKRTFSLLNLVGLTAGLACFLLIGLYVQAELAYDTAGEASDRTYRIQLVWEDDSDWSLTQHSWLETLGPQVPAITQSLRMSAIGTSGWRGGNVLVQVEDKRWYESVGLHHADPSFFDMWGVTLQHGDPATALSEPYQLILTEDRARTYFGTSNPIGQTLILDGQDTYTVTGVLAETPNSHAPLQLLTSLAPEAERRRFFWGYNYVTLSSDSDREAVEAQLNTLALDLIPDWHADRNIYLFPLEAIHLHSHGEWEMAPNGNATYVYLLGLVGILVLLIAAINFTNLSTAQAMGRAREVGVRKVLGAEKGQLRSQFLIEGILQTTVATLLAWLIVTTVQAPFEGFVQTSLTPYLNSPVVLVLLGGLALAVGLGAGSYPAFLLSRFAPVKVLKGQWATSKNSLLRQSLVVGQFAMALLMIVGTFLVREQLAYMRNQALGFTDDHVVVMGIRSDAMRQQLDAVKTNLRQNPNVRAVSVGGSVPGYGHPNTPGVWTEGMSQEDATQTYAILVDADYIETLELDIVEGRSFDATRGTDEGYAYLVNEAFVRAWEDKDLIGKRLNTGMQDEGEIIGVVKDYHWQSLHETITPLVFEYHSKADLWWQNVLSVRIAPQNIPETLAFLEAQWQQFEPEHPFEYTFMDAAFDQQYRAEERLALLFRWFSGFAIGIACLGLFGLTAYSVDLRMKEIGIRKTLGASPMELFRLLTSDVFKLLLIALLLGGPLAYFGGVQWLTQFAYRTAMPIWLILLAGGLMGLIALLTIARLTWRATRLDPVDVLRYE